MQVNPGEITVMENVEDVQVSIGHRTIADLVRETLSDDTGTKAYLRQWWLTTAIESLIAARHRAGLSQDKLAQLLGTQQSVVARMEKDDDGRMSLHRFIDYALACGEIPFDVQLIDVQRMSAYAKMAPDAARTVTTFSNHVYALANAVAFGPTTSQQPATNQGVSAPWFLSPQGKREAESLGQGTPVQPVGDTRIDQRPRDYDSARLLGVG